MSDYTESAAQFRVPPSLRPGREDEAVAMLSAYYIAIDDPHSYGGSLFDTWDSTGTRDATPDEFTADDLLSVSFLSVQFDAAAAHALLVARQHELGQLLQLVGEDRDLVDVEEDIDPSWPAWRLSDALRSIPGVGRTKASKLMARKRPHLVPIYDEVVGRVTATEDEQWRRLHLALRTDSSLATERLLSLATQARLDSRITPLRVLDVIAWMDGDPAKRRDPALRRAGLSSVGAGHD